MLLCVVDDLLSIAVCCVFFFGLVDAVLVWF